MLFRSESERIHGTSNLNTLRDGMRVLRSIVSEWFAHNIRRERTARADVDRTRRARSLLALDQRFDVDLAVAAR